MCYLCKWIELGVVRIDFAISSTAESDNMGGKWDFDYLFLIRNIALFIGAPVAGFIIENMSEQRRSSDVFIIWAHCALRYGANQSPHGDP